MDKIATSLNVWLSVGIGEDQSWKIEEGWGA